MRVLAIFIAAIVLTLAAYLVATVPGSWFPSEPERSWSADNIALARGSGSVENGEWVIRAPDASGIVLLSTQTNFRSSDYRAIQWVALGVPANAEASLLWRNDYEPGKLNTRRMVVEAGRLRLAVIDDPAWIGTITGVALVIRGPLAEPLRIRGVSARPMGAWSVLRDRVREWLAFEGWTGTSINTVVGGADVQDFPLPWVLAIACAVAVIASVLMRWHNRPHSAAVVTLAIAGVLAWAILDLRWSIALARQSAVTSSLYGSRDATERHDAAEDAELYEFVQKAKAAMPAEPVRVFVVADAHYFRGRAAYHFYPENVYFDPRADTIPPASVMRAGDWLFVYRRVGIQYDRAHQMLRWNGDQTHAAELKLVGPRGALFRLL